MKGDPMKCSLGILGLPEGYVRLRIKTKACNSAQVVKKIVISLNDQHKSTVRFS